MADHAPRENVITVKKDGLSKVEYFLFPTENQTGLSLLAARKACRRELVKYGSNPAFTLSLRSMADALEGALLDHKFALSDIGRYFAERRSLLRTRLLQLQDDVVDGVMSLADAWDSIMWAPLVDRFGTLSRDDQERTKEVRLFKDINGDYQNHQRCVISWLQFIYLERVDLLSNSDLTRVMAAAVALAQDFCLDSRKHDYAIPKYMAEVVALLTRMHHKQADREEALRVFASMRRRKEEEETGMGMIRDARGGTSSDSDTGRPRAYRRGKSKSKAKARVSRTRFDDRSDEEDGHESSRAHAYAIDGLRTQPSFAKAAVTPAASKSAGPTGLSSHDVAFHELMLRHPTVPLVWLEALLQSLPTDLPLQIPLPHSGQGVLHWATPTLQLVWQQVRVLRLERRTRHD